MTKIGGWDFRVLTGGDLTNAYDEILKQQAQGMVGVTHQDPIYVGGNPGAFAIIEKAQEQMYRYAPRIDIRIYDVDNGRIIEFRRVGNPGENLTAVRVVADDANLLDEIAAALATLKLDR